MSDPSEDFLDCLEATREPMPITDIDPAPAPVLPAPPIPAELWALWIDVPAHKHGGYYVVSIDDAPHGETILASLTEREAEFAAMHQNENYNLDCRPVRIK